jgi:hypothetical protein
MTENITCVSCKNKKYTPHCEPGAMWCTVRRLKVEVSRRRDCEWYEPRL